MDNNNLKRNFFLDIKRQIQSKNYAEVSITIKPEKLELLAKLFLEFTKKNDEINNPFSKKIPNYKRGRIGYICEERKEGNTDTKEYFHYTSQVESLFKEVIEQNKNPTISELLILMREIHSEGKEAMLNIFQAFETEFPGIYNLFSESNSPLFTLRILKYNAMKKGDFLAKGHYDRGVSTLALAESAPGLRLGKNDKDLKEISHVKEKAIFMPAINFQRITSPQFHPVWHDVVQKEEHAVDNETARLAIVFFSTTYYLN